MSAEFLTILKQETPSSTKENSAKTISGDKEKKEGSSLFDSLMNEAKKDTLKNKEKKTENSDKKNITSSEKIESKELNAEKKETTSEPTTKKEVKVNTTEVEEKIKSLLANNKEATKDKIVESESINIRKIKSENLSTTESTEIKDTNSTDTKITKNTVSNIEEKNSLSLKKMVEKLVGIVVNAAKEMFDKTTTKDINTTEITKKVEKLVEDKIQTLTDNDKIKILISQKIDIVKSSVDTITKEIKSISTEPDTTKNSIKNEVKTIKETVQGIKKEISGIELEKKEIPEDSKKNTSKLDSDNDNKIAMKEGVVEKLNVIDHNADEIKNFVSVSDDNVKEKKNTQSTISNVEKKVQVIKDVISDIKEKISEVIIVKTTGKEEKKEITVNTTKVSESMSNFDENNKEKPLLATMFLNAQKKSKITTSLEQIKDAKSNIVEKKTIEAVKSSAEKLELDVEETEVKHEEQEGKKPVSEEKKQELKTNNFITNKLLTKAIINQKADEIQFNKEKNISAVNNEIAISKSTDVMKEETIEMVVPRDIVQNLQHKIIGAQQKMGTFMNDVARNMYLNYKPPVTAFRVNLNPANLGSISIIMKANKIDNSLSVSMNLSNSNTMEAFSENKVALQSAIQRQFSDSSNVSINFSMQDQNSDNQFNQNNQENKQSNHNTNNDETESHNNEEQEIIETNDYM